MVDLLNELKTVQSQLKDCITFSHNNHHEKVIELYKKRIMLLHQSFVKIDPSKSTTHSKENEDKPSGIDEHIQKLTQTVEILQEALPVISKLEKKSSESGLIEISVLAYDMHIFLIQILERSIIYQKSLNKLLYILLTLFLHLIYNGF